MQTPVCPVILFISVRTLLETRIRISGLYTWIHSFLDSASGKKIVQISLRRAGNTFPEGVSDNNNNNNDLFSHYNS